MIEMKDRIVSNPEICGGVPCVKGTRIPVHIILSHLAAGERSKKPVPASAHNNYKKRLRYYLDFCHKYRLPYTSKGT
jgi:hypothetical protein